MRSAFVLQLFRACTPQSIPQSITCSHVFVRGVLLDIDGTLLDSNEAHDLLQPPLTLRAIGPGSL
ncbi:MAG: hypothetical protein ACREJX_06910, partial [Polyangiaceae bacterium]